MKVFVINRECAVERRMAAEAQLASIGLDFEIFNALESIDDALGYFHSFNSRIFRLNTRRQALPGEIGCFGSHRALWKICVNLREPILILEDDFQIQENFLAALREADGLIGDFGFIRLQAFARGSRRLGFRFMQPAYEVMDRHEFKLHYVSDVPLCTLAYAIAPQSAAALIKTSACLFAPVDKFLQHTWKHKVPIYALSPAAVITSQKSLNSTIGDRTEKSWNMLLLLLRLCYKAAGGLRRNSFDRQQIARLGIQSSSRRHDGAGTRETD